MTTNRVCVILTGFVDTESAVICNKLESSFVTTNTSWRYFNILCGSVLFSLSVLAANTGVKAISTHFMIAVVLIKYMLTSNTYFNSLHDLFYSS